MDVCSGTPLERIKRTLKRKTLTNFKTRPKRNQNGQNAVQNGLRNGLKTDKLSRLPSFGRVPNWPAHETWPTWVFLRRAALGCRFTYMKHQLAECICNRSPSLGAVIRYPKWATKMDVRKRLCFVCTRHSFFCQVCFVWSGYQSPPGHPQTITGVGGKHRLRRAAGHRPTTSDWKCDSSWEVIAAL
jgi:hypothetical protein